MLASGFVEQIQKRKKQLERKEQVENRKDIATTLGINMAPDWMKEGVLKIGQTLTLDKSNVPDDEQDSSENEDNDNLQTGKLIFTSNESIYTCPNCHKDCKIKIELKE